MKTATAVFLLFAALAGFGQGPQTSRRSVTWKLNDLKQIGGQEVELIGDPRLVTTYKGKAIVFDGIDDGIFIPQNPLAEAGTFTIEAIFRPDAGGEKEQRWLHIEDTENTESRALLEIRLSGDTWFLDTFLKSGENRSALFAEKFKHALGKWFHIALIYDGTEMRHYVNGKLELTGKIAMKPLGNGITSIGVRQNKVFWFKGAVLKARFTNRAIRPSEFMK